MNEAAEQALANFRHEQALSTAHARRAEGYLSQFLTLVSQKDSNRTPSGQTVRCVREWTKWLADNGPATRNHITEQTGIKFSERGTPHTFVWDDAMVNDPDDALPQSAIMRVRGAPSPGRGAPPVIFFLWSQRWDVHPLFGVGPVKDDTVPDAPSETDRTFSWAEPTDEGINIWEPVPVEDPQPVDDRCATLADWDELHAPLFDAIVRADSKPTDEQKELLRNTLPEGENANAAIAIGYRNAVLRAREAPLLGVVQPEVTEATE